MHYDRFENWLMGFHWLSGLLISGFRFHSKFDEFQRVGFVNSWICV